MLSSHSLSSSQQAAIDRLYNYNSTLLIGKMGGGKTAIGLTAASELLDDGVVNRVLIVAPKKVAASRWCDEARKWSHLNALNIQTLAGKTPAQRKKVVDDSDCNLVVANFEQLPWLFDTFGKKHGFDGLIVDEITKLKDSGGKIFKSLRAKLSQFTWRVGLTGTPVSENFIGLYAMSLVLDSGKSLGTRKDSFLRRFFYPTDYNEYNWELIDPSGNDIMSAVKDLLYFLDTTSYEKSLPPLRYHNHYVPLPKKARMLYEALKADHLLQLDDANIVADNAAVVVGKLRQLASGFLYVDDEPTVTVHHEKQSKLLHLVSRLNAPVIVAYWFNHDKDALFEALAYQFPDKNIECLGGAVDADIMARWNNGEIDILLLHPASAGHGIELQFGGSDLIFYSPVWSRDQHEQTIARIYRNGQTYPVDVHYILATDTIDGLIVDRVDSKSGYEEILASHLALF